MPQRREKRLLTPPAGDLCMVPREEDVGHGLALEITRARILWIAEQPIEEGVRRGGCGVRRAAQDDREFYEGLFLASGIAASRGGGYRACA